MSVGPISNLTPSAVGGTSPAALPAAPAVNSFVDALGDALETVAASHAEADQLAIQAATGDLGAVHDYTIAATEAQLLTQLTVEVRNRAVEAFNDIMHMQV